MQTSKTPQPGELKLYSGKDGAEAMVEIVDASVDEGRRIFTMKILAVLHRSRMPAKELKSGENVTFSVSRKVSNPIRPLPFDGIGPEFIEKIIRLDKDGTIAKVSDMIDNQEVVWLQRSSGAWQTGEVHRTGDWPLIVLVQFMDEGKGHMYKIVPIEQFLAWQTEQHGS